MAHVAKINELSEALIAQITGQRRQDRASKQLRDQTTKALRNTNHSRTNQFDIQARLDGLIEKFAVLNREDVAEALQARLNELPSKSKWMPEILSFVLLLSDKPAEKTRLADLEDPPRPSESQQLMTWEDIITENPLDEPEIWESVEPGYHSSGDEATIDEDDNTVSTDATSITDDDDVVTTTKQLVVQVDENARAAIKAAQIQLDRSSDDSTISELLLIRETIFMLRGLPSSIYQVGDLHSGVAVSRKYSLETSTGPQISELLYNFADIGSSLNSLRQWVRTEQDMAYLRSCQSSMQNLLAEFASNLSAVESFYASPRTDGVVSIIDVLSRLDNMARPLIQLSRLTRRLKESNVSFPFAFLNSLFEEACIAQASGDDALFEIVTQVLFAGLKTYLRPLSTWIQTGSLIDPDHILFVTEADALCGLNSMWHSRFTMRTLPDGSPSTPAFMQRVAHRAFACGKSKALLTALGCPFRVEDDEPSSFPEFNFLLEQLRQNDLQPFAELLDAKLEHWITEADNDCAPVLCGCLLYTHQALNTFDSLKSIFCSRDGNALQDFADALFWRIDHSLRWRDRFLLTELAQNTLGSAPGVDTNGIVVALDLANENALPSNVIEQLSTFKLEIRFSPAIQNITRADSAVVHSKAFTSILQLYRAKFLLRRQLSDLRTLGTQTTHLPQTINFALRIRQSLVVLTDVLYDHITKTTSVLGTALCKALQTADGIDAMVGLRTDHCKQMETSLLLSQSLKPIRDALSSLLRSCEQFNEIWTELAATAVIPKSITHASRDSRTASGSLDQSRRSAALSQERLVALHDEMTQSLAFVANGLRSISRTSGNTALEALADRLHWNLT